MTVEAGNLETLTQGQRARRGADMKLRSIAARNYRALEHIQLTFADDYCALSGHNNAGKSCIIRLISILFERNSSRSWAVRESGLNYLEDYTKWKPNREPIKVEYEIALSKEDDNSLYSFIETLTEKSLSKETVLMNVTFVHNENNEQDIAISVDGEDVAIGRPTKEILRRLQGSNALFLHNSTQNEPSLFYDDGRFRFLHEIALTRDVQQEFAAIDKRRHAKVRRLAKSQRDQLNEMLGRLSDKYDVEFTPMETSTGRSMPLRINLKNKNIEVAMESWGSGTQNRTQILMSLLQANSIRKRENTDEKVTPIVVIEEPESFLHPSAQAEFGKVLQDLSVSLGIQVIVSTHSPYMLNQVNPASNILLKRRVERGLAKSAEVVETLGDRWMEPFAEQLGVSAPEFEGWSKLFSGDRSRVVLVEGELDKQYYEYLMSNVTGFRTDRMIEFVPYNGKDALKNTILLKFMLSRLERYFITFDLDAAPEVERHLQSLNLRRGADYLPVGVDRAGKKNIEGLLPDRVLSAVNSRETDLIMQLRSSDSSEKRSASSGLKRKYLEEFKKSSDYTEEELREFRKVWSAIIKNLA